MHGYKLTQEQAELLQGQTYAPDSLFNPIKDKNDNYFIFNEVNNCVNESFMWVKGLILEPYLSVHYKAPPLSPYAVLIPEIYQWAFPENKFVLSAFEIPLDTYNNDKVVNLSYFMWEEFRNELDSGNYTYLKRALMPLWDYVELQVINNNLVIL
jgi:hypothetical protein